MRGTRARRRRHRGAVLLIAGGVLALPAAAGLVAADGAAAGFGGFLLSADGNGMQVLNDSPSSVIHPQAEVTEAKASVTFATGPIGYGLAASAWPGPTVANAGSLAQFEGAPSQAGAANDPARAEARTQQTPDSTFSQGPVNLHAHADEVGALATSAVDDVGPTPAFHVGSQTSTARSTVDGNTARSESTCRLSDITIATIIHIASVDCLARASQQGSRTDASGATAVSGLTIAGHAATVDDRGVHASGSGDALNSAADSVLNAELRQAGVTIAMADPARTVSGQAASYTSGSLIITQKGGGQVTAFSIGGATASVVTTGSHGATTDSGAATPESTPTPESLPGGGAAPSATLTPPTGPAPPASPPAAQPSTPASAVPLPGTGNAVFGLPLGPTRVSPIAIALAIAGIGLASLGTSRWLDDEDDDDACLLDARDGRREIR